MSIFDSIRFSFGHATAEDKLIMLRAEGMQRLSIVQAYSELLLLNEKDLMATGAPVEFLDWIKAVNHNAGELRELIDALAAPQIREGHGRPELSRFDRLRDAVEQKADELNLPLSKALVDGQKLLVHGEYPLVLRDTHVPQRQASLSLTESKYRVDLYSLVDDYRFDLEFNIELTALQEVVVVLNHWLIERALPGDLGDIFPGKDAG